MQNDQDLLEVADQIEQLLGQFQKTGEALLLPTEKAAEFRGLAAEAKGILDAELGRVNDFSFQLLSAVNGTSAGFYGGPPYKTVSEAVATVRSAVRHLRRQSRAASEPSQAIPTKADYISLSRLEELEVAKFENWDLTRLVQMCRELNSAHHNGCLMTTAVLVRQITDHVPPIFNSSTFAEVANNYGGTKSFQQSMARLQSSLRSIADGILHTHVRKREVLPAPQQVNFVAELDLLLSEIVRLSD